MRLIERIRARGPDIALSGDFIVGFPGETDADFENTLSLVRDVNYAQAFSFKYSPRPGTPAAKAEQIDEDVKSERLARLQDLLLESQTRFQRGCIGDTLAVLLEKPGRETGQLAGRSPYLQNVHLQAPRERCGEIVPVRILEAHRNSLAGELVA